MKYTLRCENLKLTVLEQVALDKKMDRLYKHLSPPYTIDVTLQHDTHHLKGDVVTCRINIAQGKKVFHAERVGSTVADCLDGVVQALQQELQRERTKARDLERREDE